jgi:ferredoxin
MLSLIARRFWCRTICPLGALLGLIARYSPVGFIQKDCKGCPVCQKKCRTGAIADSRAQITQSQECIRCFDCLDACPQKTRVFKWNAKPVNLSSPGRLSRRSFLAWCGSGVIGSAVIAGNAVATPGNKSLLRPPHSPDEEEFLDLCVRCQACVNICPSNALQPMLMQSGLYGLWTPTIAPSIGGCRVDCNRCSTVCPTHAIAPFDMSTKYDLKIGTAILFKDRCIPYSEGMRCGKCIPECPTAAIGYTEYNNMQFPAQVDFLLCVGCGICQNICNQQTLDIPAIVITAYGRNMPSGAPVDAIKTFLEKTREGKKGDLLTIK